MAADPAAYFGGMDISLGVKLCVNTESFDAELSISKSARYYCSDMKVCDQWSLWRCRYIWCWLWGRNPLSVRTDVTLLRKKAPSGKWAWRMEHESTGL
ncbi:hypothetical protein EJB05_44741, partial [Eragrostis curvula]